MQPLSPAEKIIVASGLALVGCSLLPWFGAGSVERTAWSNPLSAMGVLAAILVLVHLLAAHSDQASEPALPFSRGWAHLVLGGLSFVLILGQFFSGDRIEAGGLSVTLPGKFGMFLGLTAAAGLAYGGYRAARE
jgi:hypothetical protein